MQCTMELDCLMFGIPVRMHLMPYHELDMAPKVRKLWTFWTPCSSVPVLKVRPCIFSPWCQNQAPSNFLDGLMY